MDELEPLVLDLALSSDEEVVGRHDLVDDLFE